MKGIRVSKILEEPKFKGVISELESTRGFRKKSLTKPLRVTLVFMQNNKLREKLMSFCWN